MDQCYSSFKLISQFLHLKVLYISMHVIWHMSTPKIALTFNDWHICASSGMCITKKEYFWRWVSPCELYNVRCRKFNTIRKTIYPTLCELHWFAPTLDFYKNLAGFWRMKRNKYWTNGCKITSFYFTYQKRFFKHFFWNKKTYIFVD